MQNQAIQVINAGIGGQNSRVLLNKGGLPASPFRTDFPKQ
jgi:hypothetical protein